MANRTVPSLGLGAEHDPPSPLISLHLNLTQYLYMAKIHGQKYSDLQNTAIYDNFFLLPTPFESYHILHTHLLLLSHGLLGYY